MKRKVVVRHYSSHEIAKSMGIIRTGLEDSVFNGVVNAEPQNCRKGHMWWNRMEGIL